MKTEQTATKLYMVIEDGFAVCLTADRKSVSCWTYRQSDASLMTMTEAQHIADYCRGFYGPTVQIVGRHSTLNAR